MKKLIVLSLFFVSNLMAQGKGEFFPGGLNIQPFTANYLEPKLGFLFNFDQSVKSDKQNTLRLEIGNSIDIYKLFLSDSEWLSFGADLFTYSRLRSENNFKFPVETIDYLFGINAGYKKHNEFFEYGIRFRLSHISAHLVDGLYRSGDFNCKDCDDWTDNEPIVYSKEFIELMPFIKFSGIRGYLGYTYNYNIKPAFLGKNTFQFGFDYYYEGMSNSSMYPFIAYDFKFVETKEYNSNHSVSAGIKLGNMNNQGVSIYIHYYNGYSIHGEYWNQKINYSAIGFNLDL